MPIQLSEREVNQSKAEAALTKALVDVIRDFDLTNAEVCSALSITLARWTGYVLSDERNSASPS
jgi:hypothetical protein